MSRITMLLILAATVAAEGSKKVTEVIVGHPKFHIDRYQRALREMERQVSVEKQRLEKHREWLQKQRSELDHFTSEALRGRQAHLDKLGRAASWVTAHAKRNDQVVYTPMGAFTPDSVSKAQSAYVKSMNGDRAAMSKGKYKVHMSTLGWVDGSVVDNMIKVTQKSIDDIQKGVREGTIKFKLVGFAYWNGKLFRTTIDKRRTEIDNSLKLIKAGDYAVVGVPYLGRVSRKGIEIKMAAAKKAADDTTKAYNNKTLSIARYVVGDVNRTRLEAQIKGLEDGVNAALQNRSHAKWNSALPMFGWRTQAQLESAVKSLQAAKDKVSAAMSKGDYKAPVPNYGTVSANLLRKRIRDFSRSSSPASRDAMRKAQAALPKVAAYARLATGMLNSGIADHQRMLALIPRLFDNWADMQKIAIAQRKSVRNEFERNMREHHKQQDEYIRWMEHAISACVPG